MSPTLRFALALATGFLAALFFVIFTSDFIIQITRTLIENDVSFFVYIIVIPILIVGGIATTGFILIVLFAAIVIIVFIGFIFYKITLLTLIFLFPCIPDQSETPIGMSSEIPLQV